MVQRHKDRLTIKSQVQNRENPQISRRPLTSSRQMLREGQRGREREQRSKPSPLDAVV